MKRPQLSFKCTKILPFTPIFMYILIENVYISASKKGCDKYAIILPQSLLCRYIRLEDTSIFMICLI